MISGLPSAPREPLDHLKAMLLTLKDSGDDGFEGLVAALLSTVTQVSFRLAASGSQDGQDGRGEGARGAISFEAKLYRSKLTKSVVNNKATEVLASADPPDLWILAATVGATTQIVGTLRAAFAKVETSLLKTFFAVAVLTCILTMGAMVTTSSPIAPVNAIAATR